MTWLSCPSCIPARLAKLIATLRRRALFSGPSFVRMRCLSSWYVTSLGWKNLFSIAQCERIMFMTEAWSGSTRLEI